MTSQASGQQGDQGPAAVRQGAGPLAALKVIEFAAIGPVPLCGMLLADLGADVVRVDRLQASGLGVAMAPPFDANARSRRSVALDLKAPAGRDTALRLLRDADVLIEGFRPGVMETLGLGPQPCRALNPRLVYGRMTGFGQTGPWAGRAGHDLNYIALAGVLHAIGPAGGKPVPPLNLVGDYGGGALYLALGVLAALWERQRSGLGQVVDAAMVDGAASLASLFYGLQAAGDWGSPRGQNLLDGGAPFYDCYETADGQHLSVAALEPKFFAAAATVLGLPPAYVQGQYDRGLWPAMRQAIAQAVRQRSLQAWCQRLAEPDAQDSCMAPVLSFAQAPQHDHARARDAFVSVSGVLQPAPAPRFDRTPLSHPRPAPEIGQHGVEVLTEAGCTAGQIQALLDAGVLK